MRIQKVHITKKLALCVASAAVLALTTSVGVWAYSSPYSYVSLDVNPSIEYTLNRFERVIDVKAVNDDGQVILDEIKIDGLNHQSIEDAILDTIAQISKDGYFSGDTSNAVTGSAIVIGDGTQTNNNPITGSASIINGGIVITISNGNIEISKELVKELRETVEDYVSENVEVDVSSVGYDRVQKARELGVTPGKLNLVEKLQASSNDPASIVLEDWLNKPVKDIMKATKANKKANLAETDVDTNITTDLTVSTVENSASSDVDDKDGKKAEEKAVKDQEKALEKSLSDQEKADEKAKAELERADEKTKAELERADEKAKAELERADEKAKAELERSKEKLEKANEKAEAELERAKEKLEKANEKAEAELERAKEKLEKANEKAEAELERATEKASKAESDSSKKENNSGKAKGKN